MEALKRKPDLTTKVDFELPESGTKIKVARITGRRMMEISNNKSLSDQERGMHILAAKLLVRLSGETEYKPITYDDLLDCFSDEELNFIAEKVAGGNDEKNA